MAKLDSLIIDLQVNTAALKTGLDTAKSSLEAFSAKVDAIKSSMEGMVAIKVAGFAKEMGEAFIHLTEQMAEFALHGSEATEHIRHLAEASGESITQFSQLAFSASTVGITADDLAKGLEKLDKNLGAAGAGAQKQAGLFSALGVSVKDSSGNVRSTSDVFADLADKFSNMEDGASKTALAIMVFGKAGADMIPLLNAGRTGLEQMKNEADRLGVTLTEKDGVAAHAFQSDLQQLETILGAVGSKVATQVTPSLTALADQMLRSKDSAAGLKDAVTTISIILKSLLTATLAVAAGFDIAGKKIGGYANVLAQVPNGVAAVVDAYADMQVDITKVGADLGKAFDTIWGDAKDFNENLQKVTGEGAGGLNANVILKAATDAPAADAALKKLNATLDEFHKKIAALSGGGAKDPIAEMEERLKTGDLSKELAKAGAAAKGMDDQFRAAAKTLQGLELAKIKIDFDITESARSATAMAAAEVKSTRSDAKTDLEAKQANTDFGNIGASPQALFKQMTAGFTSFNDALQSWVDHTKEAADQEASVALNEASAAAQRSLADQELKAGNIEAANAALAAASGFTKAGQKAQLLADSSTAAAASAKKAEEAFSQAAASFHATFENFSAGIDILVKGLASKMGKLGTVIDAGIAGFQQGGIWGALAAVLVEFITQVKGWTSVMTLGNGQFQAALNDMSKGLDDLLSGLKDLMGGVETIAHTIHEILNPVLTLIGVILKGLAPIFSFIGIALEPLVPIIQIIAELLGTVLTPIFQLIGWTLIPVVETVLALELAFDGLWFALEDLVDWLDRTFGNGNNAGGMAQAQKAIDDTMKQMADMTKSSGFYDNGLNRLGASNNATDNMLESTDLGAGNNSLGSVANKAVVGLNDMIAAAQAAADANGGLSSSANTTAKNLAKMTASISNVPDGFKTMLRRYEAQSPTNGAPGSAGGSRPNPNDLNPNGSQKGSSSGAAAGQGGGPSSGTQNGKNAKGENTGHGPVHNYNIGSVVIQAGNIDELSDQLKKVAAKKRFHRTGAPGVP